MGVPPIKTLQGGWVGNDWIASHKAGNGILRYPFASLRASAQNDRGMAVGLQHKGHCEERSDMAISVVFCHETW